jgi:hypothetical protein
VTASAAMFFVSIWVAAYATPPPSAAQSAIVETTFA